MRVLVFLFFMRRVNMLVGAMFLPAMVVFMHMDISGMLMGVRMLVEVFMGVGVNMLMGVNLIAMAMLMLVLVGVFVGMQMFVFVLAFHGGSLPGYSSEPCQGYLEQGRA
jgi:hypothetical protein